MRRFFFFVLLVLLSTVFCAPDGLSQVPSIQKKQNKIKEPMDPPRREARAPMDTFRAAPPGPVHCIAEWEESEAIMTNWWNYDLIDKLQQEHLVYIVVDNQSEKDSWINYLNTHGIPLTNIDWIMIPTNTVWTRDYGPWFIWDGNNDMGIVDYNANPSSTYGPLDNAYPSAFASLYGINHYDMGLEHVGGNWFPNAHGIAFSSSHIYKMNPFVLKEDVNQLHHDYLGIEHYRSTPVAPWTIQHHDCWGKPANPETMIIVEYEESSKYHFYAEEMNEYYSTLESPWGRPYKIHRLPMFKMGSGWFEFKPYMNSLVSNHRVFVPITFSADDQVAMDVFQAAFEGYEIVGVDHFNMGFNDALHCRTRNFMKRDAIRIYPMPLGDTEDTVAGYAVTAEVIPPNGSSLLAGYPVIHWTATGAAPFTDLVMTATGQPNEYTADLPAQIQGTTLSYYIEARDDTARSAIYPLVAPDGMLHFEVRADTTAPEMTRFLPSRGATAGQWPPSIRVLCKDDMVNPEVSVAYSINGVPQPDIALTREPLCYWYSGTLAGAVSQGDLVTYTVNATDGAAVANRATLPKTGEIFCPVAGSGGVAVVDLDGRRVSGDAIQESLEQLGLSCTRYDSWPADWTGHDTWFICLGAFVDRTILSAGEAADLVAALQVGNNIYLESGDAWCFDPERAVYSSYFGVSEQDDGGDLTGTLQGQSGALAQGLSVEYRHLSAWMDEIGSVNPAQLVLKSSSDNEGRMVQNDAGTYRTVASCFPFGGLCKGDRKELLAKVYEFLSGDDLTLYASARARLGKRLNMQIEGQPGDAYLLLASRAESYGMSAYGLFRLDPFYMWVFRQGVIPASGVEEILITVPNTAAKLGKDFHFQALVGTSLAAGVAELTNREILTIVQ